MILLLYFAIGVGVGVGIAGMFSALKEDEHERDLDEAVKEAYIQGYEKGLEDGK